MGLGVLAALAVLVGACNSPSIGHEHHEGFGLDAFNLNAAWDIGAVGSIGLANIIGERSAVQIAALIGVNDTAGNRASEYAVDAESVESVGGHVRNVLKSSLARKQGCIVVLDFGVRPNAKLRLGAPHFGAVRQESREDCDLSGSPLTASRERYGKPTLTPALIRWGLWNKNWFTDGDPWALLVPHLTNLIGGGVGGSAGGAGKTVGAPSLSPQSLQLVVQQGDLGAGGVGLALRLRGQFRQVADGVPGISIIGGADGREDRDDQRPHPHEKSQALVDGKMAQHIEGVAFALVATVLGSCGVAFLIGAQDGRLFGLDKIGKRRACGLGLLSVVVAVWIVCQWAAPRPRSQPPSPATHEASMLKLSSQCERLWC